MYKDLVEYIVRSLVDYPDQVRVTEVEGHASMILELSVADTDMGRVIGKGGKVINAIRTLLQVLGAKQGRRVTLEVVDS